MLVRDAGDAWQIVLQSDHADLSGQLMRAWGGAGFARPEPFEPVVLAATRHDDGWGVWDRRPRIDPGHGGPQSFFEVPVPVHLAFYRAGVEVVCDEDAYAGMLVSMHMSGLYRGRYGAIPSPGMRLSDELRVHADAFADQEEARQAALAEQLDADEAARWTNYALLQVVDVVSLYCGLADIESGHAGATGAADSVPTADGGRVRIAIEPLGPWRLRFDPYPFAEDPLSLTMVRRLVRKRAWASDADFRTDFFAAPAETVRIFVQS